jgi:hypothetical protein
LRQELQNKRVRIKKLKNAQEKGIGLKQFLKQEIDKVGLDHIINPGISD